MRLPRLKRPFVWHPVLLGLLPIVSAYLKNAAEVRAGELLLPLASTFGVIALVWGVLTWAWKDVRPAALVVSFVLLFCFHFGEAVHALDALVGGGPGLAALARSVTVLVLGITALGLLLRLLLRRPAWLTSLTGLLNAFSILVLVAVIAPVIVNRVRSHPRASLGPVAADETSEAGAVLPLQRRSKQAPDIYYLILDAYGRSDVLQDIYGVDNRAFLDHLRQRGFFVASHSTSNYCQTPLSIASSLNGRYHTHLAGSHAPMGVLVDAIQKSTVFRTLRANGYRLVSYQTHFGYTELRDADVYLSPGTATPTASPFQSLLLARTPLRIYDEGRYTLKGAAETAADGYADSRRLVRYVFGTLGKTARLPSPKFVFAHVLCPHPPFVFGEDGADVSPHQRPYIQTDGRYYREYYSGLMPYVPGYRGQVRYLTRLVQSAIDDILKNSAAPPIIIVQGDHGPGSRWDGSQDPSGSDVRERMRILNAYYLPGDGTRELYDDISPVNSFRLVLRHYFGAKLEPLPDECYWSALGDPFEFTDITEDVRPMARVSR